MGGRGARGARGGAQGVCTDPRPRGLGDLLTVLYRTESLWEPSEPGDKMAESLWDKMPESLPESSLSLAPASLPVAARLPAEKEKEAMELPDSLLASGLLAVRVGSNGLSVSCVSSSPPSPTSLPSTSNSPSRASCLSTGSMLRSKAR